MRDEETILTVHKNVKMSKNALIRDRRYNVWKLHRPRMLHGLLADCVDTSLGSLLYSCTIYAMFSEVHD